MSYLCIENQIFMRKLLFIVFFCLLVHSKNNKITPKLIKKRNILFCFDLESWPDMSRVESILLEEMEAHPLPNVDTVYFY